MKTPNDPKLSDRSPEPPPVPEAARGEGAACALADAVTEPVKPEPGAETERQGCGSLQRMVRRCRVLARYPDKLICGIVDVAEGESEMEAAQSEFTGAVIDAVLPLTSPPPSPNPESQCK